AGENRSEDPAEKGDVCVEFGRCGEGLQIAVRTGRSVQIYRPADFELRVVFLRQTCGEGREDRGPFDVRGLQLQRTVHAVTRRGGPRRGNRHAAHAGVGRRRRRLEEADGGAPQTDGNSRGRQPSAVFAGRTRDLRGRLAYASEVR